MDQSPFSRHEKKLSSPLNYPTKKEAQRSPVRCGGPIYQHPEIPYPNPRRTCDRRCQTLGRRRPTLSKPHAQDGRPTHGRRLWAMEFSPQMHDLKKTTRRSASIHYYHATTLIKQDVIIIFMHILLKLLCGKSGEHRARWLIYSTPPNTTYTSTNWLTRPYEEAYRHRPMISPI